jgi:DMSO reductase family type II enzyme molybdopterin subunit
MSGQKRDDEPTGHLSRREFIVAAGGTVAGVSLASLAGCEPSPPGADSPAPPLHELEPREPTDFLERYRRKWSWDGVARGTHNLNCGFQPNCAFDIYTRDGVVLREEQVAQYPQTRDGLPDFNPRGCQKGCSYSELMYSAPRLTRPLRRNGERGAGVWAEVTWDEALTDIADRLIDAITEDGPDTVAIDAGTNIIGQTTFASLFRLGDVLDSVLLDMNCEIGDDQQGAAVTYGEVDCGRSGDDFFHSDLILIWSGNPAYTQIPNFHFLTEARYHGAKIVSICPDLNASAIHTDLWVPVDPGTDAALALAMAKVLIDEGLYDADFVREQTDLPFLVRLDDGKLLRESDLVRGGSDDALCRWDLGREQLEIADEQSLRLAGVVPALEGVFEVDTLEGRVRTHPVFEALKARLEDCTPEKASGLCGSSPSVVSTAISKFYHGDAMMRAQILVFALCGHVGRKGAGFSAAPILWADGHHVIYKDSQSLKELRWPLAKKYGPKLAKDWLKGRDMHGWASEIFSGSWVQSRIMTNSTLFWNLHGGVLDVSGQHWDPDLDRDVADYIGEALDKNWQLLEPAPSKKPRVLFSLAGNLLRRVRAAHKIQEVLWPKLDLIVAMDIRMSSTAMFADYVLPVAGAYEKPNVTVVNSSTLAPFIHSTEKAVPNVGDSKDDWEIACLIARKIQQRAAERGVETFTSRRGHERRLDKVYDQLTRGGEIGEKDAEKLSQLVVENSTNLGDVSWKNLKEKGFSAYTDIGYFPLAQGQASDIEPGKTIVPHTWHTQGKQPWPTRSGRLQFYVDHGWYLALGEALPAHKAPIKAGGDYPLTMTGGHTRWSIHAMWRTDPLMLRLQRGEPVMWVGVEDAAARGIVDGDKVEVFNDVGRFRIQVKVSPAVRPGQVIMYHAWENFQFEGGIGHRNVTPSPINPLRLVGDYPSLKPTLAQRQPGGNDRDTRVEIRKAAHDPLNC